MEVKCRHTVGKSNQRIKHRIFHTVKNHPSVDQLRQNTKYLWSAILSRMSLTESDEIQDELQQVIEMEKEKGWLDGSYSAQEATNMFGQNCESLVRGCTVY